MWKKKTVSVLIALLRIVVFLLVWIAGTGLLQRLAGQVVGALQTLPSLAWVAQNTLGRTFSAILTLALFCVFERLLSRRSLRETALGFHRTSRRFAGGLLFGSGLILTTLVLLILSHAVTIYGFASSGVVGGLAISGLAMFCTAFAEELVFRGYILEQMRRATSGHISVLFSAALFGLLHLPVSLPYALSAFAAGLLLGYLFLLYGLYYCIGLHFAWNWLTGVIFASGAVRTEVHNVLLAGDRFFTPEAEGLVSTFVVVGALALVLFRKRRALFS